MLKSVFSCYLGAGWLSLKKALLNNNVVFCSVSLKKIVIELSLFRVLAVRSGEGGDS